MFAKISSLFIEPSPAEQEIKVLCDALWFSGRSDEAAINDRFLDLINKATSEQITAALKIAPIGCQILDTTPTLLHLAAQQKNPAAILAIIGKLTPKDLKTAIWSWNKLGDTPLHILVHHYNLTAFFAICHKLTPEDLNAAMELRNLNGVTILQLAAIKRGNSGILELMEKIDSRLIFEGIFRTQYNEDPIRLLISDAFFKEEQFLIREKFLTDKVILNMSELILKRIKQGHQLIENLEFRKQMLSALMGKPSFSLTSMEIDLFHYLKKTTPLSNDTFTKMINRHLSDQTTTQNPDSGFNFTLNKMYHYDYIPELNLSPDEIKLPRLSPTANLVKKIQNNEILIKIVTPERYADYLQQLTDYNHRPKLRAEKNDAKFKFVHLTGKVVSYQYHAQKNKPAYTHTKKSSMTLIGSHLQTPVFGQHDTTRPQVGYLFDTNDCIIKAMLKQDKGTYLHQWVTETELDATNAGLIIPNYNFTDKNEFCNTVNSDTSLTNEVLAKVKKEAIVAIVITRNNEASIDIAKARQQDAFVLGINVPIVFYDAMTGRVIMIQEKSPSDPLNAVKRSLTC